MRDRLRATLSAPQLRVAVQCLLWISALVLFVDTASAGNGLTLSKQPRDTLAIPQWLYLVTGGATIGASALLASFVTDRAFINDLHTWSKTLPTVESWWKPLVWIGRSLGVATLGFAIYLGYVGPQLPTSSLTILVTFAGVRAGLPIFTYFVGNIWPVLNPWRTIASVLPSGWLEYPGPLKRWPAVVGLLGLVWVEVIFPVSTVPSVLATAIVLYTAVTLAGALVFGPEPWFGNADPLSVLFRFYGAVSPLTRHTETVEMKLPGGDLQHSDVVADTSDIAFIIALVWELTYSGFITTSAGSATVETIVELDFPGFVSAEARAVAVYTLLLLAGYLGFFAAYWYAGRVSRRRTGTYITARTIRYQFAPPLLAIAAGYHLAHYAGLFVSLSPALILALTSPLSPPANPLVLSPPGWFDGLNIASILVGHLLAVWTAHTLGYDLFSSRLAAVRSQYPFVAVMIGYTVVSLWIISLPGAIPPYLS